MTPLSDLRRALEDVPVALLDPDDQRVLADARTSIDALERLDIVPTAVVFVGTSGAGTSSMVNAALGVAAAPVGVVRPTTDRLTMYGNSGPVAPSAPSEYVHVPEARPGVVVIDTPPWEHDSDTVRSALAVADHVVVVVTPIRYADASVAGLLGEIPLEPTVVLNRIDVSEPGLDALLESVVGRFGADVVRVAEGGDGSASMRSLIDSLPIDDDTRARAEVLRSAATAASRHVAQATASMAAPVAELLARIEAVDPSDPPTSGYPVFEEWPATRTELVRLAESGRSTVDRTVLAGSTGDLARRIEPGLAVWEPGTLAADLDVWRNACRTRFREEARIRWRRAHANSLLDASAWRISLNDGVAIPPRVGRIMGDRLGPARSSMRADVERLLAGSVSARLRDWKDAVVALAAHTPGALLGAADDVAPRR